MHSVLLASGYCWQHIFKLHDEHVVTITLEWVSFQRKINLGELNLETFRCRMSDIYITEAFLI